MAKKYKPIVSFDEVLTALVNYDCSNRELWPYDTSATLLWRCFVEYGLLLWVKNSKMRAAIGEELLNNCFYQNAKRARQDEAPLDYDAIEKLMKVGGN